MKKIVITEQQLGNLMNRLRGKQSSSQPKVSEYETIKTEWSKFNTDPSNKKAFGEGVSQNQSIAMDKSQFNARTILAKKLYPNQNNVNLQNVRVIDEKTFLNTHEDGREYYHNLTLVEMD